MMMLKEVKATAKVRRCACLKFLRSQMNFSAVEARIMCSFLASGMRPVSGCTGG